MKREMSTPLCTFVEHVNLPLPLLLPTTTWDVMQSASFVCLFLCYCQSVSYRITPTLLDRVDFEEHFFTVRIAPGTRKARLIFEIVGPGRSHIRINMD